MLMMASETTTAIFWPMIVHVVLVAIVYAVLTFRRSDAVRAGEVKASQFRENRAEPERSLFVRNNLQNQFELPTLFYPVCIALYVTGGANLYTTLLAWLFVIARYVHAWIHIRTNDLRYRRPVFMAGSLLLMLMWLAFAVNLITVELG
ncbi:MAPEG family protein [Rhizobium sp. L1K21]|uniref:MAPEG family protein n=1 Tax=Rhizobium sp. L1K21 TaxID=2954933 RepID=UPI00209223B9|nr:MAPEG family protein [Rhizobium sp. L1K21]MCO6187026.1 MAPEG family protein [Rhizobium sp. L1K21]